MSNNFTILASRFYHSIIYRFGLNNFLPYSSQYFNIFSRVKCRNRDLGILPLSELCDKTLILRFKSCSQKVDEIPLVKLLDERSKKLRFLDLWRDGIGPEKWLDEKSKWNNWVILPIEVGIGLVELQLLTSTLAKFSRFPMQSSNVPEKLVFPRFRFQREEFLGKWDREPWSNELYDKSRVFKSRYLNYLFWKLPVQITLAEIQGCQR